jgi:AraC family transcriptional regulator
MAALPFFTAFDWLNRLPRPTICASKQNRIGQNDRPNGRSTPPFSTEQRGLIMEGLQTIATGSAVAANQQFHFVANSLAQLVETARREFERDREAAKASLVTASHILQAEIERCSGTDGSARGGLVAWQIVRVRAYIDRNLHRTIHIQDLSAIARRSPAHFSRQFKLAVGEPPHAYVVRRRLERACHLMMTSVEPLSEIALSVGFSDQAHLCRLFKQSFGQSPANWRREHGVPSEVTSRTGMDDNSAAGPLAQAVVTIANRN